MKIVIICMRILKSAHNRCVRRMEKMYKYLPITDVYAREILDSRGNPTVEG